MFCTKCGNKSTDGAVFCNKCGEKFIEPTEATYKEPTPTQQPASQPPLPQTTQTPVEPTSTAAVPTAMAPTPVAPTAQLQSSSHTAAYERSKKKKKIVIGVTVGAVLLVTMLAGGIYIGTQMGSTVIPQEANALEVYQPITVVDGEDINRGGYVLPPITIDRSDWTEAGRFLFPPDWEWESIRNLDGNWRTTVTSPTGIYFIVQPMSDRLERLIFNPDTLIRTGEFTFDDGNIGDRVTTTQYWHWVNGNMYMTVRHYPDGIPHDYQWILHAIALSLIPSR